MQLKKQARKLSANKPVRTQVVSLTKFNPVVPSNIEITHATLHASGRHVVITSQPRCV